MDVIGWASPVGLIIFFNGLALALLVLSIAVRIVGGPFIGRR